MSPEKKPGNIESLHDIGDRFSDIMCPACEMSLMAPFTVNLPSTATAPLKGDTIYSQDNGQKRKVIIAFLECPTCQYRLPIQGFDVQ